MNRRHFLNRKCQPRRWPGTPEAGVTDDARMPATVAKRHLDATIPHLSVVLDSKRPAQAATAVLGAKETLR